MKRLKEVAREEQDGQRPLIENTRFRDRLAQLDTELRALELTVLRVLTDKRGPGLRLDPENTRLRDWPASV